jgi:hypothetical protein
MQQDADLKKYKIGYGPMSKEVISLLNEYSLLNDYPIMIICSRNQIDFESSYVTSTNTISSLVKSNPNLLLCRDHCGPYFKDSDNGLNLKDAVDKCKQTIDADIYNQFDLIHIDVSRVEDNQLEVADELIQYALSKNPDILLEFGSEENTGILVLESVQRLDDQLNFAKLYKNIKFFVTQTGSAIKDRQVGYFDIDFNSNLSKRIHSYGFLFKEHNGDYLDSVDLKLRKSAGVDAINVAPQLGTIQTKLLFENSSHTSEWNNFANLVYSGNRYQRWTSQQGKLACVLASGHYFFKSSEYEDLINRIDRDLFYNKLRKHLFQLFDLYKEFR